MSTWSEVQREAARDLLGDAQPNNSSIVVRNIEDIMPANWRRGFEKLFARLTPAPALTPGLELVPRSQVMTADQALAAIAAELISEVDAADPSLADIVMAVALLKAERRADEFWKGIYPKGIEEAKYRDEMRDFAFIIDQLPKIYDHITGGRLSKHMYPAHVIIGVYDDVVEERLNEALQDEFEGIAKLLGLPTENGTTAQEIRDAIVALTAKPVAAETPA